MKQVIAARCESYDLVQVEKKLTDMIVALSDKALFYPGQKVLVKPNLLSAKTPQEVTTTHPVVIQAVVRILKKAGCEVLIADSPVGSFTENKMALIYNKTGMREVAEQEGIQLNTDLSSIDSGLRVKKEVIPFLSAVGWADVIVDCCKLKSHSYTIMTGAVKNLFGLIPGLVKAQMHARFPRKEQFCHFLCEIANKAAPVLSIMDAIEGMQGNGPSGGDIYLAGRLLVSLDPFALDYGAMKCFGINPKLVPVHRQAVRLGYIQEEEIQLIGHEESWLSLCRHDFHLPDTIKGLLQLIPSPMELLHKLAAPYPLIDASMCIGCGECAHDCPQHTIHLDHQLAIVNRKDCIRCYCCQEACPVHAIKLKKKDIHHS